MSENKRYHIIVALLLIGASLAGCVGNRKSGRKIDPKYGVAPSPRVIESGEIPRGGGRAMLGKAYTIAGVTYSPQNYMHYSAVGAASWYGSQFHGRLTANGEIYDRYGLSAAHPTLPLPSYVRVTNLKNARSIILRLNDRGPYDRGRVLDVSERAAEVLDFKRQGVAKILVEYIRPAGLHGSDDKELLRTLQEGQKAPSRMIQMAEERSGSTTPLPSPETNPSQISQNVSPESVPDSLPAQLFAEMPQENDSQKLEELLVTVR